MILGIDLGVKKEARLDHPWYRKISGNIVEDDDGSVRLIGHVTFSLLERNRQKSRDFVRQKILKRILSEKPSQKTKVLRDMLDSTFPCRGDDPRLSL